MEKKSGKIWLLALFTGSGLFFLILSFAMLFLIGIFAALNHEEEQSSLNGGFGAYCRPDGSINRTIWDSVFGTRAKSGAFAGHGDTIIRMAEEQGIDPVLAAAIMMHETGRGTSNAVVKYNNPGGIMDPASGWSRLKRFSSLEEGLSYTMANLKRRIIDDGLNTIEKLGNVYAPIGAANDPTGLNRHWIPNVTSIVDSLGGLTMNCEGVMVAGNDTFQTILNEMLRFHGWEYVWGGSTESTGFDCSGLMQWAFAKAGIQIPRTSYEQYMFSQRITRDQLQPGDFIFFKTASYNPVTHVGIYLGDGRMYNSNNSGVGYSNPFDSYWGPRIVGYGRIADFSVTD